jgi:hypothetical protein
MRFSAALRITVQLFNVRVTVHQTTFIHISYSYKNVVIYFKGFNIRIDRAVFADL